MPTLFQINVVANWGSTGRIAEEIGQMAIKCGWKSYIAYGRGKPKSQSKLIRIGNKVDMYRHALISRLLDNHGLNSNKATRKLIDRIRDIKPDIVHLHNIHGYFLNYALLFDFLKDAGIPIVWTLHDCWTFTGHCAHFIFIGCDKWKVGCKHCPQKLSYPTSWLCDRSHRNYKIKKMVYTSIPNLILVPVSDWLAGLLRFSFMKEYSIRRIYNGVDLMTFSPQGNTLQIRRRIGVIQRYMLIGVASVWSARKGLADFVALRRKLSIQEYAMVLIGLTQKQIQELPQGIVGISRTNSVKELAEYYSVANVFVNPTWEDNFPTTNLEALACDTPVITYQTGGSIEAIDEKTGIIVPTGDVEILTQSVRQICEDRIIEEGQCRKRAIELYNKNDRYKEYMSLYNELMNSLHK